MASVYVLLMTLMKKEGLPTSFSKILGGSDVKHSPGKWRLVLLLFAPALVARKFL